MIEKIHLYDQSLAFIRQDARFTTVHDSGLKNVEGGTAVNAWEALAHEFEHYWRHIIAEEVIKALNLDMTRPMPAVLLDRQYLLNTIWKTEQND
jgi:hypothetical protein